MIDGQNLFGKPRANYLRTYDFIRKTPLRQGNDCTRGCLFDHACFNENYKLIIVQKIMVTGLFGKKN